MVTAKQGLTFPVPIAHVDKVRSHAGRQGGRAAESGSAASTRTRRSPSASLPRIPTQIMEVLSEYHVLADGSLRPFRKIAGGCMVGSAHRGAARLEGRRQDRAQGRHLPGDAGADDRRHLRPADEAPDQLELLWFHFTYLDELLKKARSQHGRQRRHDVRQSEVARGARPT